MICPASAAACTTKRAFLEKAAFIHHHPVGTCRMGLEAHAVVGPDLELRGLERLHVCDGSVIPSITTGPVNAAIIAVAGRASHLLRGRAPVAPCLPPLEYEGNRMRSGHVTRWVRLIVAAMLMSSCAPAAVPTEDRPVTMSLTNAGTEPLRCRLTYGHWVDRDLGELVPGASTALAMAQSATDGALYVMRADRRRRMMIETIHCGRAGDWMESLGQVDLAPIRSVRAREVAASCAAPTDGKRVACRLDRIEQ